MKTQIFIESMGSGCRLTLVDNQDVIAKNLFENLRWVCHNNNVRESEEEFTCQWDKLVSTIQAFRASNPTQARRGGGLWRSSPFQFIVRTGRPYGNKLDSQPYSVGEYQDHSNNPWEGYRSRAENLFDKPQ